MVEDGLASGSVVHDSFPDSLLKVVEGEGEVGRADQALLGLQEGFLEDVPIQILESVRLFKSFIGWGND